MTQPHQEFNDDHIPLAYLITFRSYGTWLHGKEGSVDRFHNVYGKPKLPANERRLQYNLRSLAQRPVKLGGRRRAVVKAAVKETCEIASGDFGPLTFPPTTCMHSFRLNVSLKEF